MSTQSPKRTKPTEFNRDLGGIGNSRWNEYAGADRVIALSPRLTPLGDISAGKAFDRGATVALYNNDTVAHYARSAPTALPTAPTDGSNAVCLPPGQYFYFQMAADNQLILDAAASGKVWAYLVVDDSQYT